MNHGLKLPLTYNSIVEPLDPMNNTTLTNAFFNNQMYLNLIEVDNNNIYQNSLADDVQWDHEKHELLFKFNSNNPFKPEDAHFSIKRVILANKNLHSDLWTIICAANEKREDCEKRFFVRGDELVFNFADKKKSHLIIPTLVSIDYKVAPLSAFDQTSDPMTAKIVDRTQTTGPYHLKIIDGTYFLKRNSHYKRHQNKIETFQIVDSKNLDMKKAMEDGQIDAVPTTNYVAKEARNTAIAKGWNSFESHNLAINIALFTDRAMKKMSPEQRFALSKVFLSVAKSRNNKSDKFTVEYLQDFGQGYLNNEQINEIQELRNSDADFSKLPIVLATGNLSIWDDVVKQYPNIKVVQADFSKPFWNGDHDVIMVVSDVSFDLNYSLIAYAAKTGMLEMTNDDLMHFIELPDLQSQIKFINEIHFKTLKNCKIYPLFASPYFTYTRKGLIPEMSKFNSRTLLWKIREE